MIVCRHFVLLHVAKTGGTWLARSVLLPHAPAEWALREVAPKHGGIADIPADAATAPRFAFVRDPWDWYVSWWAFHRRIYHDRDYADGLGAAFFGDANDGDHVNRDVWAAGLAAGLDPVDEFRAALPMMLESESLTGRLRAVVGDGSTVSLHRYEDGIGTWLARAVAPCGGMPAPMVAALGSAPLWASGRGHRREYYTSEMAGAVARTDAAIIKAHGYAPP